MKALGFSNYTVSESGIVHNIKWNKDLSTYKNNSGYVCVSLTHDTKGKVNRLVHVLVADTYIANPKGLPDVDHGDNDKNNNHRNNLKRMKHSDNVKKDHPNKKAAMSIGQESVCVGVEKLSESNVVSLRKMLDGDTQRARKIAENTFAIIDTLRGYRDTQEGKLQFKCDTTVDVAEQDTVAYDKNHKILDYAAKTLSRSIFQYNIRNSGADKYMKMMREADGLTPDGRLALLPGVYKGYVAERSKITHKIPVKKGDTDVAYLIKRVAEFNTFKMIIELQKAHFKFASGLELTLIKESPVSQIKAKTVIRLYSKLTITLMEVAYKELQKLLHIRKSVMIVKK